MRPSPANLVLATLLALTLVAWGVRDRAWLRGLFAHDGPGSPVLRPEAAGGALPPADARAWLDDHSWVRSQRKQAIQVREAEDAVYAVFSTEEASTNGLDISVDGAFLHVGWRSAAAGTAARKPVRFLLPAAPLAGEPPAAVITNGLLIVRVPRDPAAQ